MMNEVNSLKIIAPGKLLLTFSARTEKKLKTMQVEIALMDMIHQPPEYIGRVIKKELMRFNETKF